MTFWPFIADFSLTWHVLVFYRWILRHVKKISLSWTLEKGIKLLDLLLIRCSSIKSLHNLFNECWRESWITTKMYALHFWLIISQIWDNLSKSGFCQSRSLQVKMCEAHTVHDYALKALKHFVIESLIQIIRCGRDSCSVLQKTIVAER